MTDTNCPTGCGRTRRKGQLMCPPCWGQVPKLLQNQVNNTWRKWRRDIRDAEALRAYRAATDAAIAAVP